MSYHIHFGAGRIGLGLELPIFLRLSRPIAILQRPDHNQEWNALSGSERVVIFENGNKTATFVAVLEDFRGSISDLVDRGEPLFVSATRRDLIMPILQAASSFSTAVGPCGFADVLSGTAQWHEDRKQVRASLPLVRIRKRHQGASAVRITTSCSYRTR